MLLLHLTIYNFFEIRKFPSFCNAAIVEGQLAALKILEDFCVAGPYCGFAALAGLGLGQLCEPVERGVVDGLCDIDTEIESAVVASPEDQHKLSRLVLHFGNF